MKTEQGESGDGCIKKRMKTRCQCSYRGGGKGSSPRGLLCGFTSNPGSQGLKLQEGETWNGNLGKLGVRREK